MNALKAHNRTTKHRKRAGLPELPSASKCRCKCAICDITFPKMNSLRRHEKSTQHRERAGLEQAADEKHHCAICDIKFDTKASLECCQQSNQHRERAVLPKLTAVEKKPCCAICDISFTAKRSLGYHEKGVPRGKCRIYLCRYLGLNAIAQPRTQLTSRGRRMPSRSKTSRPRSSTEGLVGAQSC